MKKSEVIREGYVMGLKKAQEILNGVLRESYWDDEYDYYDDDDREDDQEDDQESESIDYDYDGEMYYKEVKSFFKKYNFLWFFFRGLGDMSMYVDDDTNFSLLKNGGILIQGSALVNLTPEYQHPDVERFASKVIIKNWRECFKNKDFSKAEGEAILRYDKETERNKISNISFDKHGLKYYLFGQD